MTLLTHLRPRAVLSPPYAQASEPSPAELVRQVSEGFREHRQGTDDRLAAVEAALDQQAARAVGAEMFGSSQAGAPPEPGYTRAWASFMRSGDAETDVRSANASGQRAAVRAAMSEGVPTSGGYVAPVEWDRKIVQEQREFSPMRRLATVVRTGVRGYTALWSDGLFGSGWVGETAARPQTTTPAFTPQSFSVGQLYSNPAVTQDLLDDADFDLDGFLQREIAETFSLQEGASFINGDGVNKPKGLLTYATPESHPGGVIPQLPSGAAAGIVADGLVDFIYALPAPYRTGAAWLMNSATAASIAKLKNTTGDYLWREALAAGQPSTLLGYPVAVDENMPDVGAGATPVAFGDWKRGYVINDRHGVRVLRDPYTNKPFVNFYTTKRVGGGVRDPRAIRLLRIGA